MLSKEKTNAENLFIKLGYSKFGVMKASITIIQTTTK